MAVATIEEIAEPKLSYTPEGISGTRVGKIPWVDVEDTVTDLTGGLNTYGDDAIWSSSKPWPNLSKLKVASVDVEPMGSRSANYSFHETIQFTDAKITINYETMPYEEPEDKDDDFDETYLIESLDFSVEVLVVPVKVEISPGAGGGSRIVKKHIRIPTITYDVELPRVYNPQFALLRSSIGKVNTDGIFGADAETVLFDGPRASREIKYSSKSGWVRTWKLQLRFLYQQFGWNKTLDPVGLEWVDANAAGGGGEVPYEKIALLPLTKIR